MSGAEPTLETYRAANRSRIRDAMDVVFPYRNWRDDHNKARGEAQQVLERALRITPQAPSEP